MPTYGVAATGLAAIGTAAPYCTLNTTAARRAFMREMGMFCGAAVQSNIGLGTPANTPVATTTIVPVPYDQADASSTALLGTAWSTVPTAPTVFLRTTILGAAVGAGTIWKLALDERIIIAKSAWQVFWNFGVATSAAGNTIYVEYDE